MLTPLREALAREQATLADLCSKTAEKLASHSQVKLPACCNASLIITFTFSPSHSRTLSLSNPFTLFHTHLHPLTLSPSHPLTLSAPHHITLSL